MKPIKTKPRLPPASMYVLLPPLPPLTRPKSVTTFSAATTLPVRPPEPRFTNKPSSTSRPIIKSWLLPLPLVTFSPPPRTAPFVPAKSFSRSMNVLPLPLLTLMVLAVVPSTVIAAAMSRAVTFTLPLSAVMPFRAILAVPVPAPTVTLTPPEVALTFVREMVEEVSPALTVTPLLPTSVTPVRVMVAPVLALTVTSPLEVVMLDTPMVALLPALMANEPTVLEFTVMLSPLPGRAMVRAPLTVSGPTVTLSLLPVVLWMVWLPTTFVVTVTVSGVMVLPTVPSPMLMVWFQFPDPVPMRLPVMVIGPEPLPTVMVSVRVVLSGAVSVPDTVTAPELAPTATVLLPPPLPLPVGRTTVTAPSLAPTNTLSSPETMAFWETPPAKLSPTVRARLPAPPLSENAEVGSSGMGGCEAKALPTMMLSAPETAVLNATVWELLVSGLPSPMVADSDPADPPTVTVRKKLPVETVSAPFTVSFAIKRLELGRM